MARIGMDPKSWVESLFTSVEYLDLKSQEILAGTGTINNSEYAFYAHNLKYEQGFISSEGAIEILRVMELAQTKKTPIIALMASPGVSVKEGIKSGHEYTKVIAKNIELSGYIPQIALVIGTTMGAPAYSATLMDFVIMNKARSTLMVTGPGVIEKVIGQKTNMKDLGGAEVHAKKTGISDRVEPNIAEQINIAKKLLEYLPSWNCGKVSLTKSFTPKSEMQLPSSPRQAYNMFNFIDGLIDSDSFLEVKSEFAKSVITGFARISGRALGIVANQSIHLAGALDYESARKAARFIRLLDSFNIPLLNLIDVPGFMPGEQQEHHGLLRYGAQMCQSMQTTTPRWSVVVRRCYGAAAFLMMQTKAQGGDYVIALKDSSIAIMGYAGAKTMLYEDDGVDRSQEYFKQYEDPQIAKELGVVDEVMDASAVREKLIELYDKSLNKKYGNKKLLKKQVSLP